LNSGNAVKVTNKVTIHPEFSGTVHIFNDVSQKKKSVLPGRPFSTWCPRFAPTLTNWAISPYTY